MSNIVLSAQSSNNEVKSYFNSVLTLAKSGEKFPVDLDEVWPLCYAKKQNATLLLTTSGQFYEGEDYVLSSSDLRKMEGKNLMENDGVFTFSGKNSENGRPTNKYMLSVPCMEYLIARKVRAVFEVYRRVFHEFLNTKRMSSDEAIAYGYGKALEKINRQSTIIARQGKQLQKYKSQLESEKQAKQMRLLEAKTNHTEIVKEWLDHNEIHGCRSLANLSVRFYDYCMANGIPYVSNRALSSSLRELGYRDKRCNFGVCFIFS